MSKRYCQYRDMILVHAVRQHLNLPNIMLSTPSNTDIVASDSKSTSRRIFDKPNFDILMLIPISVKLPIASNSQRGVDPVSLRLGLANNKANGGEKRQRGLFDRGTIRAKSK